MNQRYKWTCFSHFRDIQMGAKLKGNIKLTAGLTRASKTAFFENTILSIDILSFGILMMVVVSTV